MFSVKKSKTSSCVCKPPRLPVDVFDLLFHLPDPIPDGEHYKDFKSLYGKVETTEEHRLFSIHVVFRRLSMMTFQSYINLSCRLPIQIPYYNTNHEPFEDSPEFQVFQTKSHSFQRGSVPLLLQLPTMQKEKSINLHFIYFIFISLVFLTSFFFVCVCVCVFLFFTFLYTVLGKSA